MFRQYIFCPKCEGMRKTSKSIGLRKLILQDGLKSEELVLHFHCASCNTYICSVQVAGEELFSPDKIPKIGHNPTAG
jgi:hypothetical protein